MKEFRIFAFADEASEWISEQITALQRNGLQGLEIRTVDGESISEITAGKAKEVRQKLDDAGLITWSLGSPIGKIGIGDDFQAHMEKLKHTLELGNILGAENIRLFSFYLPEDSNFDDYTDEVVDKVGKMAELCIANGICPCHENEKGIFGNLADRCFKLHTRLPQVKCIFDPANYVQCGQDTMAGWQQLRQFVKYLHIKDALADGTVVPAGKGIGNLSYIVRDFAAMGGRNVTVEPHLGDFIGLKGLEREGAKSLIGTNAYENSNEAFDAACTAMKGLL